MIAIISSEAVNPENARQYCVLIVAIQIAARPTDALRRDAIYFGHCCTAAAPTENFKLKPVLPLTCHCRDAGSRHWQA